MRFLPIVAIVHQRAVRKIACYDVEYIPWDLHAYEDLTNDPPSPPSVRVHVHMPRGISFVSLTLHTP